MTGREQLAGFMLGISVGTVIGYFLLPAERNLESEIHGLSRDSRSGGDQRPELLVTKRENQRR
jgi:hypothetical protein